MGEFWEKLNEPLCEPLPFYTEKNVEKTAEFIKGIADTVYKPVYIAALAFIAAAMNGQSGQPPAVSGRLLRPAYEAADENRVKAVNEKDFISAVRWRYAEAAVRDYARRLKELKIEN